MVIYGFETFCADIFTCAMIVLSVNLTVNHQAMSNNVSICRKKGLNSLRLLPYYPALKVHHDFLQSMPPATFTKPPHLGPLTEGREALEATCEEFCISSKARVPNKEWTDTEWKPKVKLGYERLSQTLWRVAREFDVRGYGMVLREKLTTKWCDCGCSTDHLGEVCERTVREDEEESGGNVGKRREWDGRGSGVYGWDTSEEEDIWEVDLDFGGLEPEESGDGLDGEMTISELMEWRYLKAEREKEQVCMVSLGMCFGSLMTQCRATSPFGKDNLKMQSSITKVHMRLSLNYHIINSTSPLHT